MTRAGGCGGKGVSLLYDLTCSIVQQKTKSWHRFGRAAAQCTGKSIPRGSGTIPSNGRAPAAPTRSEPVASDSCTSARGLAHRGVVATRAGAEAHLAAITARSARSGLTAPTTAPHRPRRGDPECRGERRGERVFAIGRGGGSARRATRATGAVGQSGHGTRSAVMPDSCR